MKALLEAKVKAVVALVVSGVVAYVASAIIAGQVLTLHGLEIAAATAVLSFLGVHQAPANKKRKARKA
jgi:ABC-type Co2+ transport system permease subunit